MVPTLDWASFMRRLECMSKVRLMLVWKPAMGAIRLKLELYSWMICTHPHDDMHEGKRHIGFSSGKVARRV